MIINEVEEKSNQNYVYFFRLLVHYFCNKVIKPLKLALSKETETRR